MRLGFSDYGSPANGAGPLIRLFSSVIAVDHLDSLKDLDAIVLWGGADMSPVYYNEEPIYNGGPANPSHRDVLEWEVLREAAQLKIPVIGVCLGAQRICAFNGGKLIQHLDGHTNGNHDVVTSDGELLNVNSYHHQLMYPFDINHELLAWSQKKLSLRYLPHTTPHGQTMKDKVEVEAVYFPDTNSLGVQWHPEWLSSADHPTNKWFLDKVSTLLLKENTCAC